MGELKGLEQMAELIRCVYLSLQTLKVVIRLNGFTGGKSYNYEKMIPIIFIWKMTHSASGSHESFESGLESFELPV